MSPLDNLAKSSEIRGRNAQTRAILASLPPADAFRMAASIIRQPTKPQESLTIGLLLRAVPTVAENRSRQFCKRADTDPVYRIGELTPLRRDALARALEEAAP